MDELQDKLHRMCMDGKDPNEIFCKYLQQMQDTYQAKNADYGGSFDKLCDEFGLTAPIIRLSDKLERIKTLSKNSSNRKVADERIEDTLLDLANYAVMTLVWMKRNEI